MTHQDVAYLILTEQGVINIENSSTGVAENKFDSLFLEALNGYFCTGSSHELAVKSFVFAHCPKANAQ